MREGSSKTGQPASISWAPTPLRELVRLATPIAVSMLSYSIMTLADTLFVSWLGSSALAGVGLGGTICFAILCFSFGLLRGVKIVVSQSVGAGRHEHIGPYLGVGLLLAVTLGSVSLVIGELVAELLPAIAASASSGIQAHDYTQVRMLGTPVVLVYVALREARYGQGDSRSPMIASIVSNAVNIGLDYLLVVHLDCGVEGAAWATNAAQLLEAGILLWTQAREGMSRTRLITRARIAMVLRLGLPTGVQYILEIGSFVLLAALVSAMSDRDMAAHQIALQIIHVSFLPALAVAEAGSVLVGQAVGACRDSLVRRVTHLALAVASVYTGICAVVLALGAKWMTGFFTTDAALGAMTVQLLYVAAVFQVFDGANIVARGALRGAGDVRWTAVVGIITAWVLTPPLTWLLGYQLGLGALGGWVGLCAEIILGALVLWWRLERGGWMRAAECSREALSQADRAPTDADAATEEKPADAVTAAAA